MKAGFILFLIALLALVGTATFLTWVNFAKYPRPETINIAKSIAKYPTAQSWDISANKSICFYYVNGCTEVSATISLSAVDGWPPIFNFYRQYLLQSGWNTNTAIVTSVPPEAVYTNDSFRDVFCEIITRRPRENILSFKEELDYKLIINCFPKK